MNIKHIEMNPSGGGYTRLTIVVDGDRTALGELVSKAQVSPEKYEVEIKKIRHKRGLTANAYYWVLVEKLAKVLGSSKDEVHKELVIRYGSMQVDEDGSPIVFSILAGEDPNKINPYVRPFAEGYVNGKRFIHYCVLKGSSVMDNAEFACLLDGLISECNEQGIETMTTREALELDYLYTNTAVNKEEQ